MLIDTHCHLDAGEFNADRDAVAQSALEKGVRFIVIPAVERANFATVAGLAERHSHCAFALGIHPICVHNASPDDLRFLAETVETLLNENKPLVAIGEIGLDFFIENYDRELQEYYFSEQLKLARDFGLPVLLHVRKSVDTVLKYVRRFPVQGGIAHAFNGSRQQADEFIKLGFKLGFGGAMTWSRALRIRDLAMNLPLEAIVLETDAPDIPPEWLGTRGRNSPDQLPKIAQVLADLRSLECSEVAEFTTNNALSVLPNLANLYTSPNVLP
ncbi:MAG TPA: TatD family hydrolase [Methylophilaceae bacterium]|nr:TatD family hydrolase [Methylophilaceae bacterium]